MAMVVRTNNMAVNANRQLGMNNSKVSNSLEKLASGFRINRAGDDASGLAISEKMKAQIKGLQTASANSQDGISLIQTAEGALTEVHDMLNRMVEIAGKSANGTMDDSVDRASLEKELNSLKSEVDRIAESTNFNGKKLLDGSLAASGVSGGAAGVPTVKGLILEDVGATGYESGAVDLSGLITATVAKAVVAAGTGDINITINYTDADGKDQIFELDITGGASSADATKSAYYVNGTEYAATGGVIGASATAPVADIAKGIEAELKKGLGDVFKITGSATLAALELDARDKGSNTTINSILVQAGSAAADAADLTSATQGTDAYQKANFKLPSDSSGTSEYKLGDVFTVGGQKFAFVESKEALAALDKDINGVAVTSASVISGGELEAMASLIKQKTGYEPGVETTNKELLFTADVSSTKATGGLSLQIGDTADDFNKVTVAIRSMSTKGLGIDTISVADEDSASNAITMLKNTTGQNEYGAINMVSSVRADLGALQNRLDHTINNLDVAAENMTAANSRIRDTDMANEMMEYTKMNVLTQAAQAMLAQANSAPQSVLQLLQ